MFFKFLSRKEACVAPSFMRVNVIMRMVERGSLVSRLPAFLWTHVGGDMWLS